MDSLISWVLSANSYPLEALPDCFNLCFPFLLNLCADGVQPRVFFKKAQGLRDGHYDAVDLSRIVIALLLFEQPQSNRIFHLATCIFGISQKSRFTVADAVVSDLPEFIKTRGYLRINLKVFDNPSGCFMVPTLAMPAEGFLPVRLTFGDQIDEAIDDDFGIGHLWIPPTIEWE